jgi:hypothetical protein
MGSKGNTSGGAGGKYAQALAQQQQTQRETIRDAGVRKPVGVAANENYMAPDPWRKRGPMDALSPQTTNAGKTLLG